jgi:hypothetical protein
MDNIRKNEEFLHTIASTKRKKDGTLLVKKAKPHQLDAVCEIILNILRGTVPLPPNEKKKASQHKRKLAKRCLKKLPRKRLFIKYFTIIRKIVSVALPIIGVVISSLQEAL